MRFTTASGSLYEIDTTNKKIRRLNGKNDPTPRQGEDGEFKPYESFGSLIEILNGVEGKLTIGEPAIIVWVQSETEALLPGTDKDVTKTTITSDVVSIEPGTNEN